MKICRCGFEFGSRARRYLENTSIHGLRYIIDSNSHWFERIFWLVVCCLSFVGTYFLFVATWNTYINNPISFVTETTYLDWNTTFPAVTVCETENRPKATAYAKLVMGEKRNLNYDTLFSELVYYDYCSICGVHCQRKMINCTGFNFTAMIEQYRVTCEKFLSNCSWNGIEFDCCTGFQPLQTQFGVCYTINSKQTTSYNKRSARKSKLNLVSNRKSGVGNLKFHLHENADVTIHAPEDVPYSLRPAREYWTIKLGQTLSVSFQVTEIVNDPLLEEVPIDQRQCRFPYENPFSQYPYYSFSTCVIECIKVEQMKMCGCLHHMMPDRAAKNQSCTIEGLACLWKGQSHFTTIRGADEMEHGSGMPCNCLSSCTEPEYRIASTLKGKNPLSFNDPDYASIVSLAMEALPSQRFSRNVVRTKLDLVVSMGGAAGLFLGASLLSLVELLYYCCIRSSKNPNQLVTSAKKGWGIPGEALVAKPNKNRMNSFQGKSTVPGFYPQDYLSQQDLYF